MNAPAVNICRDSAMRGYEVQISYDGCPTVVLFMSDYGHADVSAVIADVAFSVDEPQNLELGRSYTYPRAKVPA